MRVIGGSAGGLRLVAPPDRATRPIADRVKETLFAILGEGVIDARACDLYAGSGAIGIEALSRGAATCDFVEHGRAALAAIRENLAQTALAGRGSVHGTDVLRFLSAESVGGYDLAFLDPPYDLRDILAPLERLLPHLAPGATVVVKHFWRTPIPEPSGLVCWRERRFGETAITFLAAAAEGQRMEET
jgi:16S rRNA (guanine966-N2)-methyltransferase